MVSGLVRGVDGGQRRKHTCTQAAAVAKLAGPATPEPKRRCLFLRFACLHPHRPSSPFPTTNRHAQTHTTTHAGWTRWTSWARCCGGRISIRTTPPPQRHHRRLRRLRILIMAGGRARARRRPSPPPRLSWRRAGRVRRQECPPPFCLRSFTIKSVNPSTTGGGAAALPSSSSSSSAAMALKLAADLLDRDQPGLLEGALDVRNDETN